ncbi:19385_t:CDS:2 [Funneliformis geosporum]|uniref:RBR-type E3 ubiquitin transferase n=1 Tax=Funneliformis geosporum TaxID=1117311 RepID=A0A9W4SB03_9GLOM|nr:19385_t:CDS:2 [Funneliformis geosporum]CAI2162496.1 1863_t:CDS:2 [Funneliformis geosporum]
MYTFSVTSSFRKEEESSSPPSSYTSSPYNYTTSPYNYTTSSNTFKTSTTPPSYSFTTSTSPPSYSYTTSTSSSSPSYTKTTSTTSSPSYTYTASTSSSPSYTYTASTSSSPSYTYTASTSSSPSYTYTSTSPPSYTYTTSNISTSSPSFTYTTSNISTSSPSFTYTTSPPHSYKTTPTSYNYSTTSINSPSTALSTDDLSFDNDDSPYQFTVTSDYLKNLSLEDDDDDTNISTKSTSIASYSFDNETCSSSLKKKKEKECMICVESRSVKLFPKVTKYCSHPNDICKVCVSKHIETQLNSKGDIEGILCPFGDSCGLLIEYNDVQRIVNSSLFDQYDSLSLKQALRSMPDFRWCKNAGCGSGQIHSGGDKEPIMTCEACGEKSCYTHDIPWHDTLSCEEYNEAKQGEDMATQDLLNRETKQCPKCGVRITKNGGCNHMTCRVQNCKYEFCWL